jgi:hypothetical protein
VSPLPTTKALTIKDRIAQRQMRRAAKNCLIAIYTNRIEAAIMARAHYLSLATDLRQRGVTVGSMIGEASA